MSPCSCAFARFSSTSPRLMSEMASLSGCSCCQRPISGNIAMQGPQPGSVKSSITGLPDERKDSRVRVSPWSPSKENLGASEPTGRPDAC